MHRTNRLRSYAPSLLLTIAVVSGCGGGVELPDYADKLIPVSGTVTADGKPVAGANVVFHPADYGGDSAQTAYGRTDDNGKYTLTTPIAGLDIEQQAGAVEGVYKVTVNRIARPDGTPIPDGMSEADAMAEGARETVPPMFSDPGMSQVTVTVTPNGAEYDLAIRLMK